ncbi:MAG: hypothetical protein ACLTBU_16260 [Zhenhengia sp.]|uniref:hypothetical protein n=1 Tax=Zhenhengia sp. TaxID=2944208 RepID=UPI00204C0106|nr:MAG TPA: Gifsy-2 prophage ATP-binding sugar transporter-like barrel, 4 helix bundle.7A [Caudoviricetes sp.]
MALNFREQLQKDEAAFFNCNEFAEKVFIGEQSIPIIQCKDELKGRKIKEAEGTYVGEIIFLVQKEYFKTRPQEGQKIKMNNESYYVMECESLMSAYKITLGRNCSY